MHHPHPSSPRLDQIRLQPEIPLRRPVRIINQHQLRIMLQTFRLPNHRLLVLPQKRPPKHAKQTHRQKWQIPSRHKINPAQIPSHRRHRSPARKPHLPAMNLLQPHVGQDKIDRSSNAFPGNPLQQLIRSAIRTGRMRAHPKSIRDRLKLLLLLVNAVLAPPKPGLMHKRPVRRIHQADDPLVHMRRQLAVQMCNLVFLAEHRQRRRRRHCLRKAGSGRIHVNPDITVALFARIVPRKNPLHFQLILRSQRRNLHATRRASIKPPPVVTALNGAPIKVPVGQRYPPVRTRIPHGKRPPLRSPPQNQRHLQQHSRNQPPPAYRRAPHRRIPKIPKKPSIRLRGEPLRRRAILPQNCAHRFAHNFVRARLQPCRKCASPSASAAEGMIVRRIVV